MAYYRGLLKRIERNLKEIPIALSGKVYARWCATDNFGDALNPLLISKICGSQPVNASSTRFVKLRQDITGKPDFMVIGSILQWCGKHSVVWGSGFISADSQVRCPPRRIEAVRGPLTRQKLIQQGMTCPEVFGDPALLLPRFIRLNVPKRYPLGVIPHYVDKRHPLIRKIEHMPDVLLIDVLQSPEKVIAEILSCERIASSSLHGIIVADAYRIPSLWLKFSDDICGGVFKFHDYFASVGTDQREMITVQESTAVRDLLDKARLYSLDIDLDLLWAACPIRPSSCHS